jgi:Rrf2 family protein
MRAVLDLAIGYGQGPIQIKSIAQNEGISNKYLEQLISILKAGGITRSFRGPKGGYELARSPKEITLKDVFIVLEGPLGSVDCLEHPESCARCVDCITRDLWKEINDATIKILENKTLEDLVANARSKETNLGYQI